MENALAPVEMLDEFRDSTGVFEFQPLGFAGLGVCLALISKRDLQAVVQEGELAKALGQRVKVVLRDGEDFLIGQEVDFGAALFCRSGFPKFTLRFAFGVGLLPDVTVAPDLQVELVAEIGRASCR